MPDPFDHCEMLVREADRDRFLATLFAPAKYRRCLFALYAFNIEIARVREVAREPLAGELRLQWWREVFTNSGQSEARGNPVAAALLDAIVRYRLPPHVFVEFIDARTFDFYDEPMRTVAELESYAAKTFAAMIALAARVLNDGNEPGHAKLMDSLGAAQAIAGVLTAFPVHAARRQLFVPLELLERHGATAQQVFAGKATDRLRAALSELQLVARRHLSEARAHVGAAPVAILPALLPAALIRPVFDRMERRGYDPFAPKPLSPWRRQWILWRAARKGLARFL